VQPLTHASAPSRSSIRERRKRVGVDFQKELLALSKFSKEEYRQAQAFVDFLGWYETADSVFFAMEFFQHGDLSVHTASIREEEEIKDITMGVLRGLNIMHTEGFTHRDLKPQVRAFLLDLTGPIRSR
jgi:serine/threonine protein kinase